MVRGTTANFKFELPCMKKEVLWATIKFWQPGNEGTKQAPLPITKKLSHCPNPEDSTELCVSLDAEETSRFSDRFKAKVQLRAQRTDGTVFGCHEKTITVYPISDDILDEDPMLPTPDESGFVILDGETIVG